MAPTEGRFAMPEWRWDCRHGTPWMDGRGKHCFRWWLQLLAWVQCQMRVVTPVLPLLVQWQYCHA